MVSAVDVYVLRSLEHECRLIEVLLLDVAALVHTFPFVYCDIRDGVWKERYNSKLYYWSGFLALAPQVSYLGHTCESFDD